MSAFHIGIPSCNDFVFQPKPLTRDVLVALIVLGMAGTLAGIFALHGNLGIAAGYATALVAVSSIVTALALLVLAVPLCTKNTTPTPKSVSSKNL